MFERREIYAAIGFKAVLAELIHGWLLCFRNLLDEMHDCPLSTRQEMAARIHKRLSRDNGWNCPDLLHDGRAWAGLVVPGRVSAQAT